MFGPIGGPEMVVILIIALLIFGPRKLPELAKSLGKGLAELRRTSSDLKETLEREITVEERDRQLASAPAKELNGEPVATTPATGTRDPGSGAGQTGGEGRATSREAAPPVPEGADAPGPDAGEKATRTVPPGPDSFNGKD